MPDHALVAKADPPKGRPEAQPAPQRTKSERARLLSLFGFRNISALYILVVLIILFSLWIPDTFLTSTTWRTLVDSQSIVGLAAVALVIPLAAGVFNLAVGVQVGAAGILVGALLSKANSSTPTAILIALLAGILIGLLSGLLVVKARIDSFIATLGVSSLLAALITAVSDGEQILGLPANFANIGTATLFSIPYLTIPVATLLIVSLAVWYVLERTPVGRRIYATGGNIEAARLAGVKTSWVIVGSLMACGAIASLAGILVTARLANADPTIGPGYLLPAFTAAFLGSTQFRGGRFNVWGTVVAVYVLAIGVKGLQLGGAPVWIPDAFNGASLLIAVGMAKLSRSPGTARRRSRLSAIRRLISRPAAPPS